MTTRKTITIIVPTFNHGAFIKHAVESVEQQTYEGSVEIIVVDDCTTKDDGTHLALKEFRSRGHKVIQFKENRGKWAALNAGIEQAQGTLIGIQDADDACHPQRLERQIATLERFGSYHNLCLFEKFRDSSSIEEFNTQYFLRSKKPDAIEHNVVTKRVNQGKNLEGINHYFLAPIGNIDLIPKGTFNQYQTLIEPHGASTIFYKQHWANGIKFVPGNLGLRVQVAEDSDHNTKLTLLLQRTSILCEKLYWYRQGTGTNPAWKEAR